MTATVSPTSTSGRIDAVGDSATLIAELNRVKVLFQQRAICAALGINQSSPSPHLTGDDTSGGAVHRRPAALSGEGR